MDTDQGVGELRKLIHEIRKTPGFQSERFMWDVDCAITKLMEETGVTKDEILIRVGKNQAWLTNILHGDNRVSVDSLSKVFWALGYRMVFDIEELCGAPYAVNSSETHGQLRLF